MKRALDDSQSGTNSNSPVDNGKSKKLKLFNGTDCMDISEEAQYSEYGSKAKLIKEIVLIRKGRMNVTPKLESISASESSGNQNAFANIATDISRVALKLENVSASESSGNHSTLANNAMAKTAAHVEDHEDIQLQSGDQTADLVDPLVVPEVAIIDGISPLKGNAFPDYVPKKHRSRRSKFKMRRKKALHVMKNDKPQVLDDCEGKEESPIDVGTFEITELEDAANEKRPEIVEECSVSNKVLRESQINLLLGKSLKPQELDDHKGIEVSPNGVGTLETIELNDDANGIGPEIAEECAVSNKELNESQIKIFLGKSAGLDDDIASDGEAVRETDGLDDIWMEFGLAMEIAKGNAGSGFDNLSQNSNDNQTNEDCEHSLILKDDIGYVCRVCGKIETDIQKIFEFQYKTPRSSRTYARVSRSKGNMEHLEIPAYDMELSENENLTNFSAHPRHGKQMRPHQVEGFRFLARNLVSDKPSGCILAHAPGSGKTFMIISFIQSFMGKYPNARPLIILPKGILAVWKTEFLKWQIEDIPLYDLYTSKPDRSQQLEVLSKWVKQRSILFMGYMQFSSIMSGVENENTELTVSCQKILSEVPSLLILDEGHTPRNNETEIVNSISKVKTPRKVVLSGTLYQNHVREVFNIVNLVLPKFLQSETSKAIVNRIMSRVAIGGKRINKWSDGSFHETVEQTLQSDDLNIKLHVIKDLREMTQDILHYYKGDFLDDLPGLEDYTVVLNLTAKQQAQTKKLKRISSLFKRSSVGSAVYLHPDLKRFTDVQANNEKQTCFDDTTIDRLIKQVDINDGVKAKFFLNVLRLCQVTGEKLLVFSQYLLPLKFLERLTVEVMNWSAGLEMFMITGDSNSEMREHSMNQFNNTPSAKVFFGSIKACGEGISLVGASRIIILDVHPNPSVTRQAVGRAFRPGQKKKVFVYRLIAAESMEEEDHKTYFRKELISKLWFEWNEHRSMKDFELKPIDVDDSGDKFLESTHIHSDVKALYKR